MAKPKSRKHNDQTKALETQIPMFVPQSDWKPPRTGDLPDWPHNKNARVAIDVETCDPDIKRLGCGARRSNTFLCGYSFRIEDGPGFYVPLRHQGGDNVENVDMALAYLNAQARAFPGILVGANLGYDCDWLAQEDIDFIDGPCRWRDIQVADPLINELHDYYSLQAISERYSRPGKNETLLRDAAEHYNVTAKGGIWKLPARFVGPYGLGDVDEPLAILRLQERRIEEEGLWDIFDLECEVQPVLTTLRRRGVRIDQDKLAEIERWSRGEEKKALDQVKHLTGIDIGVGRTMAPKRVAPVLQSLGIKLKKTAKGQWNIDQDVLDKIEHPVADHIAWARKVSKLRTTFAASVKEHMVNGRLHTTYNQLRRNEDDDKKAEDGSGARYGRLSSEKPNLQQQPARDSFAKMWREIYLPEEGSQWGSLDYSQQEPRLLMHYAEAADLGREANAAAAAFAQAYRDDPMTDNHTMVAKMAGIERKPAKVIFLGIIYGMGGAKACRQLGLDTRWGVFGESYGDTKYFHLDNRLDAQEYATQEGGRMYEAAGEEGQVIIDKFNATMPFVRKLAKLAKAQAKKKGFVTTILGRVCHFPLGANGEYDWVHKSLNRVIQGSAADQTKKALVMCHRDGHFLQLQIHDEIAGSFTGKGDAGACAEIMENCVPQLKVPSRVDVELGTSWGDSM